MPYIIDHGKVITVNVSNEPKPLPYHMHDLNSVFTHWDDKIKQNVPTENKLYNGGIDNNGSES
jgi:hypothetical protein